MASAYIFLGEDYGPEMFDEEWQICSFLQDRKYQQVQAPRQADLLAHCWRRGALFSQQGHQALAVADAECHPLGRRDGWRQIIKGDIALQAHSPEGSGELQGQILISGAVGDVDFGDHLDIISVLSSKG